MIALFFSFAVRDEYLLNHLGEISPSPVKDLPK